MGKKTKSQVPDGGARPGGESGTSVHRPPRFSFDWCRENIEAFLIAVVLAVVIRHFSVEAFEIPTGSMANTLYGMHAWLECPNCSTSYNVALQSDSSTGEISVRYERLLVYKGKCPNPSCELGIHGRGPRGLHLRAAGDAVRCGACGTVFHGEPSRYVMTQAVEHDARCPICHHITQATLLEKENQYGGHKILVTKFAYILGEPKRWDVIVFEFDQWKNYIKRLVGLPGERIDVWDGDLYVNGVIQRKTPNVQEALWTKISDSDVAERGLNRIAAWEEVAPAGSKRVAVSSKNSQWNPVVKRWSLNAAGDVVILKYQRNFDNYYSYNLLLDNTSRGYPPDVQVGDKKVACTVRVPPRGPQSGADPSWVGAEIREGDFTFQLRIPVGAPSADRPATIARLVSEGGASPSPHRDEAPGGLKVSGAFSIPVGVATRMEFENVDDRVAARIDGKEVLALEYRSLPEGAEPRDQPPCASEAQAAHYLYLIASNVQTELESIQVYRDLYYIARRSGAPWSGIQLGEGEYFAMGDNAPSSSDGRYWGSVPEENLMGKAFFVFWPALPTNFHCKFIR